MRGTVYWFTAKGGGAFVGANNSQRTVGRGRGRLPLSGPANNSGWNVGVGLEYAFWGGWSAKAEYDYVSLNSAILIPWQRREGRSAGT